MANTCLANIFILEGTDNNKKEFIKHFTNNPYKNLYLVGLDQADAVGDVISIDCRWSVYSSLMEGDTTYFKSVKEGKINIDENLESTSLEQLTKKYNLIIKIESKEEGLEFREFYLIENGEVTVEEVTEM